LKKEDGEDDEDAIQLLNMAATCQKYRLLPRAGGLLDQDAWFVEVLQTVANATTEREKNDTAKKAKPVNAGRYGR
jgi:hypothetical protein